MKKKKLILKEHEDGICQGCLNVNDRVKKPVKRAADDIFLCKSHWGAYQDEAKKNFSMDVASFHLH